MPVESGYFASSAKASFVAFTVLVVLVGIIFRLMTGNTPVSLGLMAALEAVLAGLYLWTGEQFAGLFPTLLEKLSLFDRFIPLPTASWTCGRWYAF